MYSNYAQKVITHNGVFHADEVFAIALLKKLNKVLSISRTRDSSEIKKAIDDETTIVIDCGGEYNPLMMNFDHHQDLNLPASNMLILHALKGMLGVSYSSKLMKLFLAISDYDTNRNDIHQQWEKFNKDKNLMNVNNIIAGFNRNPNDDALQMECFEKAVDFAIQVIDNIFYQINEEAKAESIYDNKEVINDTVAIFNEFCPIWKEKDEFIFAIMPNPQGWSLNSKNSTKYPLPEFTHDDLVFQHKGKFIAVFKTKEAAIECASLL